MEAVLQFQVDIRAGTEWESLEEILSKVFEKTASNGRDQSCVKVPGKCFDRQSLRPSPKSVLDKARFSQGPFAILSSFVCARMLNKHIITSWFGCYLVRLSANPHEFFFCRPAWVDRFCFAGEARLDVHWIYFQELDAMASF